MKTRRINGTQLEKMLRNGAAYLQAHEQEVNDLNVFPVPDGDTGTNMYLTLSNGLKKTASHNECGPFLKELSSAMLLAARGNSGVILSQIFTGFALEVGRCPLLGPGELRNALIRGYRNAYAVTIQPVEGTILTVCREGIEHIRPMISRSTYAEDILAMYIAEMRKTLSYTPEMLAVLKESGVIDSGALGYIYIFEGMLKYLYGEIIDTGQQLYTEKKPYGTVNLEAFNEYSAFEDGYCMEFILQLMRHEKYTQRFSLNAYIEDLKFYGNSLVVVQDGQRVKVHIHTFKPAKVMALSQEFGEFLTFKLDNMQVQHNEHQEKLARNSTRVPFAVIAVSSGAGMTKLFRQLGCAYVIECYSKMGVSAEEFLDGYKKCNAETIVVLPNDSNLIRAAEQAAELNSDKGCSIVVLPSKSSAEGYFALAMDVQDGKDADHRILQMRRGLENVSTLCEVRSSKPYSGELVSCDVGEEIAILDKVPVAKGDTRNQAMMNGFEAVENIGECETAILFRGEDILKEEEDELSEMLEEKYPLLDVTFVDGGQHIQNWIAGII